MNTWNARDARSCFTEVMRRVLAGEPQRVRGDHAAVVVLSEGEYESLVGRKTDEPPAGPRPSLVEFMRNSPLARAVREGDLPEDLFDRVRNEMWGHMPPSEPVKAGVRNSPDLVDS